MWGHSVFGVTAHSNISIFVCWGYGSLSILQPKWATACIYLVSAPADGPFKLGEQGLHEPKS